MATIDSLAPETLSLIFELVGFDSADRRNAVLLSASLVCRRWRDEAQRALFTFLSFGTSWAEDGVDVDVPPLEWLACAARTRYPVRSLHLGSHLAAGVVAAILHACEGLENLCMEMEWMWTGDWVGWGDPPFSELWGLRSLSMTDSGRAPFTLGDFAATASLTSLTLDLDCSTPLASHFHPMFETITPHLTTLTLTSTAEWDIGQFLFMEAKTDPFHSLLPLLESRAGFVTQLSIAAFPCSTSLLHLLTLFTTLTRLTIDLSIGIDGFSLQRTQGASGNEHGRRMAPHLAALASIVPSTVTHLFFTLRESFPLEQYDDQSEVKDDRDDLAFFAPHLVPFAAGGNGVGVRTIAFPRSGVDRFESFPDGRSFIRLCEGRGIDVVLP